MLEISITQSKSQRFQVQLENVNCTIKLSQRTSGLFLDLYANGNAVCLGIMCENANRLVRYDYLRAQTGFKGELFFTDSNGTSNPEYSELGTRYKLYYLTSAELAT